MQSDLFSCSVCLKAFNRHDHLPKIIPTCGHTLCLSCLTGTLLNKKYCPLDRKRFPENCIRSEDFPSNLIILQVLEEKFNKEFGTCSKHSKPKDMACVTDRLLICEKCAVEHRNHNIKTVKELKTEAQVKKNKLTALMDLYNGQQEGCDSLIKSSKKSIVTMITQECDKVRDAINQKEKEIIGELELFFENTKTEIDQAFENEKIVTKKCKVKISDLDYSQMNERFFETLEKLDKKFPDCKKTTSVDQLPKTTKLKEKKYVHTLKPLVNSLISMINNTSFDHAAEKPIKEEHIVVQNVRNTVCDLKSLKNLFELEIQEDSLIVTPGSKGKESDIDFTLLKGLNVFKVGFQEGKITGQHFNGLKDIFSQCEKIKELRFDFNNENFNDDKLALFCSDSFWASDRIETLTIDLSQSKISEITMSDLIEKSLSKMSNVKAFRLYLDYTQITDESIFKLVSQFIAKNPRLSEICLSLGGTGITDASIIEMCKTIKPISKDVRTFILGVSNTYITDQSLITFASENLNLMANLDTLELYLCKTQLTDKSFRVFCEHAKDSLINAKRILINLGETRITDFSISVFCSVLRNSTSLKDFIMYLDKTKISDLSMEQLCENVLPLFKNLECFTLDLEETGITGKSIESLTNLVNLTDIPNLKKFDLEFSDISIKKRVKLKLDLIQEHLSSLQS